MKRADLVTEMRMNKLLCRCDSDRPRLVEGVAGKPERD